MLRKVIASTPPDERLIEIEKKIFVHNRNIKKFDSEINKHKNTYKRMTTKYMSQSPIIKEVAGVKLVVHPTSLLEKMRALENVPTEDSTFVRKMIQLAENMSKSEQKVYLLNCQLQYRKNPTKPKDTTQLSVREYNIGLLVDIAEDPETDKELKRYCLNNIKNVSGYKDNFRLTKQLVLNEFESPSKRTSYKVLGKLFFSVIAATTAVSSSAAFSYCISLLGDTTSLASHKSVVFPSFWATDGNGHTNHSIDFKPEITLADSFLNALAEGVDSLTTSSSNLLFPAAAAVVVDEASKSTLADDAWTHTQVNRGNIHNMVHKVGSPTADAIAPQERIRRSNLEEYAKGLKPQTFMGHLSKKKPDAIKLKELFDSLIKKYSTDSFIPWKMLKKSSLPVAVLDTIPENSAGGAKEPKPFLEMLIDDPKILGKAKEMIKQIKAAYNTGNNGTSMRAKFATTGNMDSVTGAANALKAIGITEPVNSSISDVVPVVTSLYNLDIAWGTTFGLFHLKTNTRDSVIELYIGEGMWNHDTPSTELRNKEEVLRTLYHELAHWLGMRHIPEQLIDDLKEYGCTLFGANSLECPDLFELSPFDAYYLNRIPGLVADPNFTPPLKPDSFFERKIIVEEDTIKLDPHIKALIIVGLGLSALGFIIILLNVIDYLKTKTVDDVDAEARRVGIDDTTNVDDIEARRINGTPNETSLSFLDRIGGVKNML